MTCNIDPRLAHRLCDLPSNLVVDLVTTLALAARLAVDEGLLRCGDLTDCLSGRCARCAVLEALDFVEE